ncbi:MAG: succinyl-diaminopimelate desuccinylase [Acidimicrobiales bacterium]
MKDLLQAAAELVDIPSPSKGETAIANQIELELRSAPWLEVLRVGDNLVARTSKGRAARVVMAGHLDTVPPAGNERARIEGDTLFGLGAVDMKGGLAVMIDLACSLDDPAVDITWCFYCAEESDRKDSGLLELFEFQPDLLSGDVAILCEPTGGFPEAGCQGTLRMRVEVSGKRAHAARPHRGRNAIHRLGPVIDKVASLQPRRVELEGCHYTEALQAVWAQGGVAGNVVPDRASVTLNYRFAPDRAGEDAAAFVEAFLEDVMGEPGDSCVVLDRAPGAMPNLDSPLLSALLRSVGRPPRAKLGWTDVATFAARGLPAINLGPGDPELAHHPDESVKRQALEQVRDGLRSFLQEGVG